MMLLKMNSESKNESNNLRLSDLCTYYKSKGNLNVRFFDGVHIGHQKLIKDAKLIAEEKKLPLMVMTFDKHPKEIYKMIINLFI